MKTKYVVYAVLGLVGLIAVVLGGRYVLAPMLGIVQEREITNRGAYRIQAYEKFYD